MPGAVSCVHTKVVLSVLQESSSVLRARSTETTLLPLPFFTQDYALLVSLGAIQGTLHSFLKNILAAFYSQDSFAPHCKILFMCLNINLLIKSLFLTAIGNT